MRPHCPVQVLNRLSIALAVIALLLAVSSPLLAAGGETPAQQASITKLTIAPNPAEVGQTITFTAKVSGATGLTGGPTGTVTFLNGSNQFGTATLDKSGIATITSSSFAEGTYTITAMYAGDSNFGPSSDTEMLTVVPMGSQKPSTTSLKISPNPAQVGQTITFTARVTGGIGTIGGATGTVTFYNGSDQLSTVILDPATDVATYTSSSFAVGTYTITAAYSGDGNYLPSTSPPVTLMVVPVGVLTPTTTTLTSSAPNANFGDSVTFSATVSGGMGNPPTGTVTFLDGTSTIGSGTLSNGLATFSTTSLSVGIHSITAQYSGDSNFLSSTSAPLTETISSGGGGGGGTTFYLSVSPGILNVNQGSSGTATVTVSPSGGFNQQITFVCSNLPLYANCSFNPSTITPDGSNKPVTTTLTVTTGGSSARLMPPVLRPSGSWPAGLLAVFSVGLLGLVQVKARGGKAKQCGAKVRTRATWFLFMLCLLATLWLVACGGSGSKANSVTPKGQTVVTVAGSYSTGGQSTSFTLNVQ
jgi:Bacterial Ig-like domain (group 3)